MTPLIAVARSSHQTPTAQLQRKSHAVQTGAATTSADAVQHKGKPSDLTMLQRETLGQKNWGHLKRGGYNSRRAAVVAISSHDKPRMKLTRMSCPRITTTCCFRQQLTEALLAGISLTSPTERGAKMYPPRSECPVQILQIDQKNIKVTQPTIDRRQRLGPHWSASLKLFHVL